MRVLLNYLLNKQWILRIVIRFLSVEKQERIIIAKFRAELAFWGHDTSDMTDEEIKEAIVKVSEMISKIGFTTKEMTDAMRAMANFA
jgi:hypothetical protein